MKQREVTQLFFTWHFTGARNITLFTDDDYTACDSYSPEVYSVLPVAGKNNAFIFMADRWKPANPADGSYVWLPVGFEGNKPVLRWKDQWDLNVFD
jgi:hypothetical protein